MDPTKHSPTVSAGPVADRSTPPRRDRLRTARLIALVALGFTLLNATKPLVIDDAIYHAYAEQVSHSPADPYGFEILWASALTPAHHVVAPPVLPYWWGVAIALFGGRPVLWKLWLLPFAVTLAWALHRLFARFAPGLETPLTCMTLLSPVLLPSFNLMLDVPSLALGLASLVVLLRAGDEGRKDLAALAGLIAGVAMQTKYNAALPLLAGLGWTVLQRRWPLGVVAGALAGSIFVGWELLVLWQYGDSAFLRGLTTVAEWRKFPPHAWGLALLSILGAAAPGSALLGLAALGVGRRGLLWMGALSSLPLGLVIIIERLRGSGVRVGGVDLAYPLPEQAVYGLMGVWVLGTTLAVAARQLPFAPRRVPASQRGDAPDPAERRSRLFLLLWLALEIVGFFAIAPFFAMRRVIGLYVVSLLLAGHLLTRPRHPADAPPRIGGLAAFGIALGLLFAVADHLDAVSHVRTLRTAESRIRARAPSPSPGAIWFIGGWGFGFEAERLGMRPVIPDRSRLRPGDWLLVPNQLTKQEARFPEHALRLVDRVSVPSAWPWSTMPSAYAGPLPIRARRSIPFHVTVFRVESDFVPSR